MLDAVAVGAGPANLSLAALAAPVPGLRVAALERSEEVSWHPGMMLPRARLQVSPIKDLVTLVDPTSRYTFLNFLRERRRLYRALVAHRGGVGRREFEEYYRWVATELESVRLGHEVRSVDHDGDAFVVEGTFAPVRARCIVIGVGQLPQRPSCAEPHLGRQVFHSSDFGANRDALVGKEVLVVGSGQSGAEVVDHLLSDAGRLPRRLTWLGGRRSFGPLDDSPFANEMFTPPYVRYFERLPARQRGRLLDHHRLASDGITQALLERIYERLYELDYLERTPDFGHRLIGGGQLVGLDAAGQGFRAQVHVEDQTDTIELTADVVVLATGYRPVRPDFIAPLSGRLELHDDLYRVAPDYTVRWDGPPGSRIYVQNASRATHGLADPNLSLVAWRSAVIINSIADRCVYSTEDDHSGLWLDALSNPPLEDLHGK